MTELTEAQKRVKEWREGNKINSQNTENTENDLAKLTAKIERLQKSVDEMNDSNRDPVDMSTLLVGVPIIFTILVWWGGISYYFIGTLISAMVIMTEASNAPNHRISNLSGIEWFVISSVFWFFTYPYYMMKRNSAGLSNLLLPGIVLAVVFFGSMIYTIGQSMKAISRMFM